jgi:hypothetical protein
MDGMFGVFWNATLCLEMSILEEKLKDVKFEPIAVLNQTKSDFLRMRKIEGISNDFDQTMEN